jgi:hypothetical protein
MSHCSLSGVQITRCTSSLIKQLLFMKNLSRFSSSSLNVWTVAVTLMMALTAGSAQALCWIDAEHPKAADGIATSDQRVATSRQLAHRIHAIVKGNAAMQSLQDTRVRSRWQIGHGAGVPARSIWYQARDHRPSMWVGECGLHESADRLPPKASVVVQVNNTNDLFNGQPEINDESLRAWREPPTVGQVQGRPLYFGWQLVFTVTGRPPWVPVSTAEFLDSASREIERQVAANGGNFWVIQRAALERYRASLSATALAAQARNGWVWQHPGIPIERYPLLVKLDPSFPWDRANLQRPQILSISIQGTEEHAQTMQRVLQTLDLAAFEALVQAR